MEDRDLRLFRVRFAIILTAICAGTPFIAYAEDELSGELRRCSVIDDSISRLDCYDLLSGRNLPAASELPELPAEEKVVKKTLDDLGSESLPQGARKEAEKLEVRAKVSRCEKDYRKKYLFYFDNGQIWKQTSDKRLYIKDCNFDVTITQDFFGYKMRADGEKRQIRISRVK